MTGPWLDCALLVERPMATYGLKGTCPLLTHTHTNTHHPHKIQALVFTGTNAEVEYKFEDQEGNEKYWTLWHPRLWNEQKFLKGMVYTPSPYNLPLPFSWDGDSFAWMCSSFCNLAVSLPFLLKFWKGKKSSKR